MTGRSVPRREVSTLGVRLLLVLLGSVLTLVVGAGPAAAHDALTGSAPADGSTVSTAPASVVLSFDEPAIAMGSRIIVTGPAGEVQQGAPVLVDTTVTQALRPDAPAGRYTVDWRVTSADGHPVSGQFTFAARAAGTGDATSTSPAPAPAAPTTGAAGTAWPWILAVVLLSFVVVGVVALGRRAVAEGEDP